MNYYDEIKEKLIKSEIYDQVQEYSKDRHKVQVYFEIGRLLSEAGKEYGKSIIKSYSEKLMVEVGTKYNERTLRRIRQFYDMFANEKWSTMWTKLCWSHYREVLSLKDINEIDLIPNPILIKANKKDEYSEYALKIAILNNLDDFLRELGAGFTYVGNEYKIKLGDRYNYIDLLLYNIKHRCYVVVELKVTELKKEHIGQIEVYMNYIDEHLKNIYDNKTVGIIICKENNEYIIKYCSDERIISRTYKLV